MDFTSDTLPERAVDELVTRDGAQTLEGAAHQRGGEMSVVVGAHIDVRLWK